MKKIPASAKILLLIWAGLSIIISLPGALRELNLPEKIYSKPVIITEYYSFDSLRISQIGDDGTYLYVLVGSGAGYVQMFDLNGNYKQTISLFDPSLNGVFGMAVDSGKLYVRDPAQNIYVFVSGDFVEFISNIEAQKEVPEDYRQNSDQYIIRHGSIWKVNAQEEECIVRRSLIAIANQYHLVWLFNVVVLLIVGICTIRGQRKD